MEGVDSMRRPPMCFMFTDEGFAALDEVQRIGIIEIFSRKHEGRMVPPFSHPDVFSDPSALRKLLERGCRYHWEMERPERERLLRQRQLEGDGHCNDGCSGAGVTNRPVMMRLSFTPVVTRPDEFSLTRPDELAMTRPDEEKVKRQRLMDPLPDMDFLPWTSCSMPPYSRYAGILTCLGSSFDQSAAPQFR